MEQSKYTLASVKSNLRAQRPDLTGVVLEKTAYALFLKMNGKSDEEVQASLPTWEKKKEVSNIKKSVLKGEISAEEYKAKRKEILPPRKNGVQKQYNDWASRVKGTPGYENLTHIQLVSEASRLYKEGHTDIFRSLEEIAAHPLEKTKKSRAGQPKTVLDFGDMVDSSLSYAVKAEQPKLSRADALKAKAQN